MTSHQHVLTGTLREEGVDKSGNRQKYCMTWILQKFEGLAIHVHVHERFFEPMQILQNLRPPAANLSAVLLSDKNH